MAGTTTQATLGLVIMAKDEARSVFDAFATNLASQMTKIEESLRSAFNMDNIVTHVDESATKIATAFDRIRTSETELGSNNFASRTDEQMNNIATSVARMEESVTRNLNSVTTAVTKMSSRVRTASTGINFGEMQNAGMIMQSAGERILGVFSSAIKSGADFDQSIKNVTASLNANLSTTKLSSDQIDALSRSALQMGQDGFFSANQIAEAMNTMSKQGITYQQIMSGGIQTVYKVAAANQSDLEETANVVSDIYNEMGDTFKKAGLSAKDASQEIGNSMTVALHHARISMSDFLQTMKYVGPQASAAGMSIQDVSAAIAILGEHGIRGSQAGTTLRRMLTNLTPSSAEAASMMKKLGMITKDGSNIFYDASGKMKSMTDIQGILHDKLSGLSPEMQQFAIKTIFGQYALSGMTAIVNTGNDKFKELTKEMHNNALMDDILAEKKKGLGMQLQALNAHWETMKKEIGLALMPVLVPLIGILNKMMSAFEHLSDPVKKFLVIGGALTGVLLVVGGSILAFIGTFGMFVASASYAAAGLSIIGSALGSLVAPVAVVIALVAGLKYAWNNDIGGIREVTSRFVDWFKGIFSKTFTTVHKDVSKGLAEITKGFTGWNRSIMGPVNRAMNEVWTAISAGMKKAITVVSQGITAVTGWFAKMAPDFNKALHNIIAFLMWLTPLWKTLWAALKIVVGFVFDRIVGIVKHFWGVFSGIIQLFTHLINGQWRKVFQDLWQIVKNALLLALDLWGGFAGKAFGWIGKILEHTGIFGKVFSKIFSSTFKFVEKIADSAWKMVEKIFTGSIKVVTSVTKGLSEMIQLIFKAIKTFIEAHASGAMSALKKLFTAGFNIAKTLVNGFWIEVTNIFKALKALFSGEPSKFMKYLIDAFKAGFATAKRVTSEWWSAVSKLFNTVKTFIVDHATQTMYFFKKKWSDGVAYVRNLIDPFFQKISSVFNSIRTAITTAVTKAMEVLKNVFQTEVSFVKTLINGFMSIVKSVFSGIKDLITGHSSQAMSFFKQAFQTGVNMVKGILQGLFSVVDGVFGGLPSKLLSWGSKGINGLISGFKNGVNMIYGILSAVGQSVDGALSGLPSKMLNWGKNAMNMFVSGIKSGIGAIGSAVSSAADKIKSFLGFHSPTKEGPAARGESDQWMPNMMNMLAKGIDDNKDKIQKSTMGVALGIKQTFSGTQDHIHKVVNGAHVSSAPITNPTRDHRQVVVNINVEGRSVQSDKQLAEHIARQFRTQMSMVLS